MRIKHWIYGALKYVPLKKFVQEFSHFQSCMVYANLELNVSLAKLRQAKRGNFLEV